MGGSGSKGRSLSAKVDVLNIFKIFTLHMQKSLPDLLLQKIYHNSKISIDLRARVIAGLRKPIDS